MSKVKSRSVISPTWIIPAFLVGLFLIVFFTIRRSVEINVVGTPAQFDQLPPAPACRPTPYSFRVSVPCGEQMFRRAAFRCQKPTVDFGTEVSSLGDNKTCRTLSEWYQVVQDRCRTKDNCPVLPPSPMPSPIPPILRSCPPTPTCRPWEQMITGDPIDPNSDTTNTCPAYRCINKAD